MFKRVAAFSILCVCVCVCVRARACVRAHACMPPKALQIFLWHNYGGYSKKSHIT